MINTFKARLQSAVRREFDVDLTLEERQQMGNILFDEMVFDAYKYPLYKYP